MKSNFSSTANQITYMSKFVRKYTNINLKCQSCGNEGNIHNNIKGNPYLIQIMCCNCKCKNKLDEKTKMYIGFPLIDVKQHIDIKKMKQVYLNDDLAKKINKLTKTKLTKTKALKSLGILNKKTYERIISEYEIEYDKNIRTKLNKVFSNNRNEVLRNMKISNEILHNKFNNIAKIKLKKGITNRDMEKYILNKYNDKLYNSTISNISRGKIKPVPKTKCYIAESLGVSVADVFPEDKCLDFVYTYNDYIKLNKIAIDKINDYVLSNNITYTKLSKDLEIPINAFYSYNSAFNYYLSTKNLSKIIKFFNIRSLEG